MLFIPYILNLTSNEDTNYSLWKTTTKLKRPKTQTPPSRKPDGSWAKTSMEQATTFANHLYQTFQPNNMATTRNATIVCDSIEREDQNNSIYKTTK